MACPNGQGMRQSRCALFVKVCYSELNTLWSNQKVPGKVCVTLRRVRADYAHATQSPLRLNFGETQNMLVNRRELCATLPGMMLSACLAAQDKDQEQNSLRSGAYTFENLPVQVSNDAQFRQVLKGKLATGESLEVHETTLPVGGAPHPPHHHVHSEMWLIREGTVELTIKGQNYRLGPGSVGFVHSNDEHGIKNVGTTPATYFVVAIGPGSDA